MGALFQKDVARERDPFRIHYPLPSNDFTAGRPIVYTIPSRLSPGCVSLY
jgi:hypothetical protein